MYVSLRIKFVAVTVLSTLSMVSNACSRFLATARISPCVVAQGTCFDRKKDDWKGKMQEWSGKRDSNPQPSAWKADALAVELFPHFRGALSQASLADPRASACPVLHRSSRQSTCLLQPRQLLACATLLVQKWWRGVDLNHRSLTTTDLQSVPFGHSGNLPY